MDCSGDGIERKGRETADCSGWACLFLGIMSQVGGRAWWGRSICDRKDDGRLNTWRCIRNKKQKHFARERCVQDRLDASAHVCYRGRAHTQTTCSQGNYFTISRLFYRPNRNQRTDLSHTHTHMHLGPYSTMQWNTHTPSCEIKGRLVFGVITPMNLAIVETMRDIRFFLINFLFFYAINDVHLFNA